MREHGERDHSPARADLPDRLLDAWGVADFAGIAVGTARDWMASGRIRSVKLGGEPQSRRRVPFSWLCEDLGVSPSSSWRPQAPVSQQTIEAERAECEAELTRLRAAGRARS